MEMNYFFINEIYEHDQQHKSVVEVTGNQVAMGNGSKEFFQYSLN